MPLILPLLTAASIAAVPCRQPEAHQFDFWLGEWDVLNRYKGQDGWVDAGRAWVRVFPAASGCVIIELWRGYMGNTAITGFSMRAWDPAAARWKLVLNWPGPNAPSFGLLEGTFTGNRGDFFANRPQPDGSVTRLRYSFVNVSDTAFQWTDGTSRDGGATYDPQWIMEYRKRPAGSLPVFTAPPSGHPGCHRAEDRAGDGLHGVWQSADRQTHLRSLAILDGCATLDLLSWRTQDGEPREAVMVRSWIGGTWVEYLSTTARPAPVKLEGSAGELASAPGSAVSALHVWNPDATRDLRLRLTSGADSVSTVLIRR